MSRHTLTLALRLTAALTTFPTVAAEIKYDETRGGTHFLLIRGEIERGDAETFSAVANALPPGKVVVGLDSPGGVLRTGLNIGITIHKRGYGTVVYSECDSVCGLIWLAGTPRSFAEDANLGFHVAYIKDENGDVLESGQGNALAGAYLANLGLSYTAIAYLTSAAPDEMAWLTPAKARQLGISLDFLSKEEAGHTAAQATHTPPPVLVPALPPMALVPAVPLSVTFPHLYPPRAAPSSPTPATPTHASTSPADPPRLTTAATAAQLAASSTFEYAQGRQDRLAYEQWFLSLPSGTPYQKGALFWASNRLPRPPTCQAQSDLNWQAGCTAAKARLTPIDGRHTEANYWWGWNSL
jgi:hypothetical protein